ncbi:MAG: radical SAM protein [Candidatus Daviesbacteria bacterium]|nr:radical SAM protein [Candidatus Daviesbacteria bacterium]
MNEKVTPYLRDLALNNPAIQLQFHRSPEEDALKRFQLEDPLEEDKNEVVKGLVHKYSNRALIKVSLRCAAHCRFCTRYRQIGSAEGDLEETDIDNMATYLSSNPQIDDVILSGGDPLYAPKTTINILKKIRDISSIKVFRVGTRLPVHNPSSFESPLLKRTVNLIDEIGEKKPFFMLINFQHPNELTEETLKVVRSLRRRNITLLSQTVFLKGVNNSVDNLMELFQGLYHNGVIPYYIFRCDYVKGVERFVCDIKEEQEIMTLLRSRLSGIACPTYVVDVPGHGKIPVPLSYWDNVDLSHCRDFKGQEIPLDYS